MQRKPLIEKIRKELDREFESHKIAANYFGITNVYLSRVLNSDTAPIPECILNWIGYKEKSTTYEKVQS